MYEPYDHESRLPERWRNPSLSEAQIALMVEEEVERNSSLVTVLSAQLGLDAATLDNLFITASQVSL